MAAESTVKALRRPTWKFYRTMNAHAFRDADPCLIRGKAT